MLKPDRLLRSIRVRAVGLPRAKIQNAEVDGHPDPLCSNTIYYWFVVSNERGVSFVATQSRVCVIGLPLSLPCQNSNTTSQLITLGMNSVIPPAWRILAAMQSVVMPRWCYRQPVVFKQLRRSAALTLA